MKHFKEPLSNEEISCLLRTPASKKEVKIAAILSLYTGKRMHDLVNLKWSEVHDIEDGKYCISVIEPRTRYLCNHYISLQVRNLLQRCQDGDAFVFPVLNGMPYQQISYHVRKWGNTARLKRRLSPFLFRRTNYYKVFCRLIDAGVGPEQFPIHNYLRFKSSLDSHVSISLDEFMRLAQIDDIGVDINIINEDPSFK